MTIKFLFFPFTHITQNQLDTLLTFLPLFHHLPVSPDFKQDQTLQNLFEQGKITPFFSSRNELEPVEQKFEQYLAWASIHKGNQVNLKSLLRDTPYFTSDTHVTAIKSQIKGTQGGIVSAESVESDESVLQRDLLFLKMAQLCDEQNERIDLELKNLDKTREKMVSALRGLEEPPSEAQSCKTGDRQDFGAVMTRERISAWSGCMAQKGGIKPDGNMPLFVTTSEAVFDHLESNCKDIVNTLDIDQIKVHENCCENKSEWQHQFCDYLMDAIQGCGNRENDLPEIKDGCSLFGQIKLSYFSGNGINNLFNMSDIQIPVCLIKLK
ncbi:hypothetical protein [Desulfobacula toluolica]|uniref:Conserved uncharacterized protein n=1 Tax=Desulfobacula toluolica (strain DSM 7467 / Tol2) TaxID=651182 RepID=K0NEX9_DESTT|nr:hypothetical protein [Desulfobacula toluolica]CCK79495.1 conserved uncharacterized protein, precursor [Desulfobacula toluolica Tol2]